MAATSVWAQFVQAVNSGSAKVTCGSIGELSVPVQITDAEGNRVKNITFRTGDTVDIAKRLPREAILKSAQIRDYIFRGLLKLV